MEQGGLAATAGAKNADKLPGPDMECDITQDGQALPVNTRTGKGDLLQQDLTFLHSPCPNI